MITVYDLLEINEKASKEEIEKAYQNLIMEYHKDPKLTEEENRENEIILNKLKFAYEILSDDEKRKRYDNELAKRRAEELIKNVTVQAPVNNIPEEQNTTTNSEAREELHEKNTETIKQDITNNNSYSNEEDDVDGFDLSKEEKKQLRKAAKKEFKENLKKAQRAEEEYNKAYNEEYNKYLRKMGYKAKEPWTMKRVKNLVITLFSIVIVCALIWIIPLTRNLLIQIYEENFVVKALVDIVIMIFNAIIGVFKS